MKNRAYLSIIAAIAVFVFAYYGTAAQSKKIIVLVRHAEKLPAVDTDMGDPDLSPEGRQRAERLVQAIKKYRPHEIFVTDYKRTRQTAEPIANRRRIQIQTYDPLLHEDLIKKMMAGKTKSYLIVGHSNTIPALANLIVKKEIFRQMPDNEFGVI